MARPAKSNVVVSVEVERVAFEKLNSVYALMGLNLLEALTSELQKACDNSIATKIQVFESFGKKDGNTKEG